MTPRITTLPIVPPCPTCAHHDTLVVLGDRLDHPHPWLVWRTRRTFICVCHHCGEVVTLDEQRARRGRWPRERHPSPHPVIVGRAGSSAAA
jgi:hypothetical protein